MASKEPSKEPKTILFLGGAKVGKTCIIKRFLDQEFQSKYRPTVEDIFHRRFEINGKLIDIEFLDTSGSFNFVAMRRICISKATAILLVFSLTDANSLNCLSEFINQIREERDDFDDIPLIVVGNKLDQKEKRVVYEDQLEDWLAERDLPTNSYILTSAKEEDGIWEMFTNIWEKHHHLETQNEPEPFHLNGVSETEDDEIVEKRRSSAFAILTGIHGFHLKAHNQDRSPKVKRNSRPSIGKSRLRSKSDPIKVDCVIS